MDLRISCPNLVDLGRHDYSSIFWVCFILAIIQEERSIFFFVGDIGCLHSIYAILKNLLFDKMFDYFSFFLFVESTFGLLRRASGSVTNKHMFK